MISGSLRPERISALNFESANNSVVKAIKQRDLLNTWLRLFARAQSLPRLQEYQPSRFEDERMDIVYYSVDTASQPPRLTIQSNGTRMASGPMATAARAACSTNILAPDSPPS
jgi:hypothetical protein